MFFNCGFEATFRSFVQLVFVRESINISHIIDEPLDLGGTKYCYVFSDSINLRNIIMCFKTKGQKENIVKAYKALMQWRTPGDRVEDYNPEVVNTILSLGCNEVKAPGGLDFDLPEIQTKPASELRAKGLR